MANAPDAARSRFYLSGWIFFFILAHLFHHLLGTIPVPLLPMIRSDFSLGYTEAGLVIAAFNLSYGIAQLPGGWLGDHFGPRIMMTISICGVALAGFFVGLTDSFLLLIFLFILMGVLGGGYHPAAPPLISNLVGPENRGRGMGFHLLGGNASNFLGPLCATAIAAYWGWRSSFLWLAVPTMAFGILLYFLIGRVTPEAAGKTADRQSPEPAPAAGHLRRLTAFMILTNFTGAMVTAATSFLPLFLVDRLGVDKGTAGVLYALIFAAGFVANPLGGVLSDRFGTIPMMLATCLLSGLSIYLLNLAPYGWGFIGVLLFIGAMLHFRMPVSEAFIISQTSARNRSFILGIYYFGNIEASGVLTPLMGYLIDRFGFADSFTITGAAIFAATLICGPLLRGNRR